VTTAAPTRPDVDVDLSELLNTEPPCQALDTEHGVPPCPNTGHHLMDLRCNAGIHHAQLWFCRHHRAEVARQLALVAIGLAEIVCTACRPAIVAATITEITHR
jgi:hypothetical protein